jgi:hypothetical protein
MRIKKAQTKREKLHSANRDAANQNLSLSLMLHSELRKALTSNHCVKYKLVTKRDKKKGRKSRVQQNKQNLKQDMKESKILHNKTK